MAKADDRNYPVADWSAVMVGESPNFLNAKRLASRMAQTDSNLVILGESGTGKELFARYIHALSPRRSSPFLLVNCATLAENSEALSVQFQSTKAENAVPGTLFFDEVTDLSLPMQLKLLDLIKSKDPYNKQCPPLPRFIFATTKILDEKVKQKKFRQDLFYRIFVCPLELPPLRQRADDVLRLATHFVKLKEKHHHLKGHFLSDDAQKKLLQHHWPGNVREVKNVMERALIYAQCRELRSTDFLFDSGLGKNNTNQPSFDVENFFALFLRKRWKLKNIEDQYIRFLIGRNRLSKSQVSAILGIDRKTLYRKVKKLSLQSSA